MQITKAFYTVILILVISLLCTACSAQEELTTTATTAPATAEQSTTEEETAAAPTETTAAPVETTTEETTTDAAAAVTAITWDSGWEYADYSVIHTDSATLYRSQSADRRGKVICVNAGHGTKGGSSVRTQCHPDGSAKVTGGSTAKGSVTATAISEGTTLLNGTTEADANLSLALLLKDKLLESGFDVLMVRESKDAQLDNIARTVIANNNADCHIALHYDSSESDKGLFYLAVPDVKSYRAMEPVQSHWQQHDALGEALVDGARTQDVKIFSNGRMEIDLTQTSYSTIPSVDLEVGDRASDCDAATQGRIADGIVEGLKRYFSQEQ